MKKETRGGKRAGAGRKPSPGTVLYQIRVNLALRNELRAKFGTKELNRRIREFLYSLSNESIIQQNMKELTVIETTKLSVRLNKTIEEVISLVEERDCKTILLLKEIRDE